MRLGCFNRAAVAALILGACGGGGGNGADMAADAAAITPKDVSYSCDFPNDMGHVCTDFLWIATTGDPASLKASCTSHGGVVGSMCDRSGVIGGCKAVMMIGVNNVNSIIWFYFGTQETVKQACATTSRTYEAP